MSFFERMDSFLEKYTAETRISGVLRVTRKDEVLYEKQIGMADKEKKIPFTSQSLFTIYSLSKPFCALGLMKLAEGNLINIDCHPKQYLPEATGLDSRVTIRHMLHHNSGLPDFMLTEGFQGRYQTGYPEELREQLVALSKCPNTFEPGTDFMYANINFNLCAMIIENVTGMKYADYMKSEVFEPLGMKHAQIDRMNLFSEHRVTGYVQEGAQIVPTDRRLHWMLGGGDILATVDDVYCLNHAIKHRLLINAKNWETILTPSPIGNMGMGCSVSNWYGKKRIMHNGGHRGFRSLHIQLPEDDFDIIYLSNCGWGNARSDYAEEIFDAYYGANDQMSDEVDMDKGYI